MALPTYKAKQRGEISFDGQYEWTGYNWSPVSSFGSGGVNADSSRTISQSLPSSTRNTGVNSFYNTNSGLPYIGDLGLEFGSLDFVENSFEYKTDFDQFGYEKFYFPEDILFYPYSDCEDRAIFFSYLVKTLLKLDVVGLDYKTHVATAIKFNSNINGDYVLINNERYIICDPTYIGASAGMCMPQFKTVNPEIITPD